MVYEWKKPMYKVSSQEAGEYLEFVSSRDGGIKPSVIVEEAREPNALLHPCFEWNDTEAASKYREEQARAIVRNIVVVHISEERQAEPSKTRAFVHVTAQNDSEDEYSNPRYLDIKSVLSDAEMRTDLLCQAKKELISFKAKYKGIMELAEILDAIDRLSIA